MKRFMMAMTLACTLSVSALGGAIPCDLTPPPPPSDTPPAIIANSPGDIPWDLVQQGENAAYAGFVAVVGWLV